MRLICKALLWMLTCALPIAIAACYGVMYRYSKSGTVTDAETKQPIPGIEVACLEANNVTTMASTWDDGTYTIEYDTLCEQLRFTDIDGASNGGPYQEKTIPFCPDCAQIDVELTPEA